MHTEESPTARPIESMQLVEADLSCVQCGYNLRTLAITAACPECATLVAHSLHGDRLQFASPEWLKSISKGITLIVVALGAQLILGLLVAAMIATSGNSAALLAVFGTLAAEIVLAIGAWKFTQANPRHSDRSGRLRPFIRSTALLNAATSIPEEFIPLPIVVEVFDYLSIVLPTILIIALLTYCRRLALQIPNEKQAGSARVLVIAFCLCLGLLVIMLGIDFVMSGPASSGRNPVDSAMQLVACFFGVLTLVYIVYMDRFRRTIKAVTVEARENWDARAKSGRTM